MSDENEEVVEELPGQEEVDPNVVVDEVDGDGKPVVKPVKSEGPDLTAAMTELGELIRKGQTAPAAPVKEPTQTEINEFWAVYNPEAKNKEFFKHFFSLPDDVTPERLAQAKEMFGDLQAGLMRQAMTGSKHYIAEALEKIKEEYGPVREYVETAKREKTRAEFYGEYPALNDEKFSVVVSAVAAQLNGKEFKSNKDYFEALAEGAAENIKRLIPEFDLGAKPKPKPGNTPKLNRTSAGGGGGAGKGKQQEEVTTGSSRNDIDLLE